MARYEAGETLASIARTYDCSPPAISYIVSRSRARQPEPAAPSPPSAPQLIKHHDDPAPAPAPFAPTLAANGAHHPAPSSPAAVPERPAEAAHANSHHNGNGFAPRPMTREREPGFPGLPPRAAAPRPPASPQAPPASHGNGEPRPKLHLSLGNGHANGNGNGHAAPNGNGAAHEPALAERHVPEPQRPRAPERDYGPERNYGNERQGGYPGAQQRFGYPTNPHAERSAAAQHNGDDAKRRDGGAFIDSELRARVDGDIAAFLAAFDAALAADTQESRTGLREATDRLLRAGARTRIELERLEARVPLTPPRERDARADLGWRSR